MLAGTVARVAAEMLQPAPLGLALGGFAAVFELAAITLFALIIHKSMKSAIEPRAPYERFLFAAMFWFVVQAVCSDVSFFAKVAAETERDLVFRIAVIDGPLRDIQLFGFAAMMIAGVSLRMFPMAYGLPRPARDRQALIFWLMNGSLLLNVASYILVLTTRNL